MYEQLHDVVKKRGHINCVPWDKYYKEYSKRREYEFALLDVKTPSKLLGLVFEENICPHFSNQCVGTSNPHMMQGGTCMKYGSYGHGNLAFPWGISQCTLEIADICPIYNHGIPYGYGVKDGKKPYNSTWWSIRGEDREEQITGGQEEVFRITQQWWKVQSSLGKVKND